MNKKFTAILTAMLCLTTPVTAYAADIDADAEVQYVYEASTFTYESKVDNRGEFYLESEIAQPDAMVIGHIYATEEYEHYEAGEVAGYIVARINGRREFGTSVITGRIAKQCFGEQKLEVGDLLDFVNQVNFSSQCFPITEPGLLDTDEDPGEIKYIGNGVDIFGEEFKKVIRLQLVIDQAVLENKNIEWVERFNVDLVKGDVTVDDSVNILDSIQINKAVMAGAPLCDYAKLAGDVNENGALDADDSLMILKETIGLTENFE